MSKAIGYKKETLQKAVKEVQKDLKSKGQHATGEAIEEVLLKRYKIDDLEKFLENLETLLTTSKQIKELEKRKKEVDKRNKELQKELKEVNKKLADKKTKTGKFKRSGHLTDQILKYVYPKDKQAQLSIFDALGDITKKDIEGYTTEVKEIVEGIKLSPSEQKIIDSLCILLHKKSPNLEQTKEDYYAGNIGYELVEFGGHKNTPAPKLAFTLYELTQEYKGGEYVSGKDIDNVKQVLQELDTRKFLLSYIETAKTKDGRRIERKIEDFRKLIHILKISETEFSNTDIELSKREDTIILLNPIFTIQIETKFILYPLDLNRRTIIAYGSHNLSETSLRLREYLAKELSLKHYKPEMYLERLYFMLNEKWMKESRKRKVKEFTDKALATCKALGLLLSWEIVTGATGEDKIIFMLNKKWE